MTVVLSVNKWGLKNYTVTIWLEEISPKYKSHRKILDATTVIKASFILRAHIYINIPPYITYLPELI
jgi:hypothetical protein